ncbi:uncharacterized protein B0I36DRAFT_346987 [Microdochium trichocladiopsis]|uniref:WSC domain-containing protein n=1 Tax=Microdochium trichocladiopsis TaxID=1682393 RepID=A0A9P9BWK3_9PEZI|nr:uncharacterized protein B0I36DRAFT_346987 [Microdochium trichocladiopsis]KAH7035161.1 hypothetical protein B0I36DRAFT_346987 [Microdochium trichocladiopsis]
MPSIAALSPTTTSTSTSTSANSTSPARSTSRHGLFFALLGAFALLTQPVLAVTAQPRSQPHNEAPASPLLLHRQTPELVDQQSDLAIFNYSSNYNYAGCYNDTNMLNGSTGAHALDIVILGTGFLTAPMCLEWCAHNGTALLGRPYKFAGLEYSRECYCGDNLNSLVRKLDDSACNTYCDGDNTTACGGANKLSLYNITASALHSGAGPRIYFPGGGQAGAVLVVAGGLAALFGVL